MFSAIFTDLAPTPIFLLRPLLCLDLYRLSDFSLRPINVFMEIIRPFLVISCKLCGPAAPGSDRHDADCCKSGSNATIDVPTVG